MNEQEKRDIMVEHYQNPINKGYTEDSDYIRANTNNESCIDEVNLMVKIKSGIITDILFNGESCAICTSSASIMNSLVLNKTVEHAIEIYNNIVKMVDEEEFDRKLVGNAIVYEDISKKANRRMCTLLPWITLDKVIKEYRKQG